MNEPAEMIQHWLRLADMLETPITPVVHRAGLVGLIREQMALPNFRQRWCTRMLKIEPYARWLSQNTPCISYVGIRADEPERESGDYSEILDVTMRFPLREWGWGICDVLGYLAQRKVTIPKRTDCKMCFYQRLIEWWEFWRDDIKGWMEGESLETLTGHTFRSPGRDTWPASMSGLRERFEAGDVPKETRKDPLSAMQCRVCRL